MIEVRKCNKRKQIECDEMTKMRLNAVAELIAHKLLKCLPKGLCQNVVRNLQMEDFGMQFPITFISTFVILLRKWKFSRTYVKFSFNEVGHFQSEV